MAFVKLVKNKAYFKRFQVKYRRRREGRTDYYARKRLVAQDKNKYNSPKYRFVVRFTNTRVICQVVYAKVQGDFIMASATSTELKKYGIEHGLKNYTAAYCTGLLCARRLLTKVGLADKYEGVVEPTGEFYEVEPMEDGPRPFKCFLDVGLKRTSTGARVFAAMKGASDGGIYIPHSEKRFPGYDTTKKTLDAEVLRTYIYGTHVADYMRYLEEEDEDRYKKQFSTFLASGLDADGLEEVYQAAFEKIREDPMPVKKVVTAEQLKQWKDAAKPYRLQRLTYDERKAKVQKQKAEFLKTHASTKMAVDEDDE